MSRRAPRPFSLALDELALSLAPPTSLARVQRAWAQAVGPTIAAAGTPTSERGGVITVSCSDAVWASELTLMGAELSARLNEALGEEVVRELRARAG